MHALDMDMDGILDVGEVKELVGRLEGVDPESVADDHELVEKYAEVKHEALIEMLGELKASTLEAVPN